MLKRFAAPLAALSILTGCGLQPALLQPSAQVTVEVDMAAEKDYATLNLSPALSSSKYSTLATIDAYTRDSVDSLQISLYKDGVSTAVASLTLSKSQLDNIITFKKLKKNTVYRVVAIAYDASGATISKDDSVTVVAISNNDQVNATISVNLKDKIFSGVADSNIVINDGQVINAPDSEEIAQPTPTPQGQFTVSLSGTMVHMAWSGVDITTPIETPHGPMAPSGVRWAVDVGYWSSMPLATSGTYLLEGYYNNVRGTHTYTIQTYAEYPSTDPYEFGMLERVYGPVQLSTVATLNY